MRFFFWVCVAWSTLVFGTTAGWNAFLGADSETWWDEWEKDPYGLSIVHAAGITGCDFGTARAGELSGRDFERRYRDRAPLRVTLDASSPLRELWTKRFLSQQRADGTVDRRIASEEDPHGLQQRVRKQRVALGDHVANMLARRQTWSAQWARIWGRRELPERGAYFHDVGSMLEEGGGGLQQDGEGSAWDWWMLRRREGGDVLDGVLAIGPSYTGRPFHQHGESATELLHGTKLWVAVPPKVQQKVLEVLRYQIDEETPAEAFLRWRSYVPELRAKGALFCIQEPGELVYIPEDWTHFTLNVGETLSVARIRSDQEGQILDVARRIGIPNPTATGLRHRDLYLVGDDHVVALLQEHKTEAHPIFLPVKGSRWRQENTGKVYEGGGYHMTATPLGQVPVFKRLRTISPPAERSKPQPP